jgi:hypothetical protein
VTRAANIPGWTIQLGGGPLVTCTRAIENDRRWFATHHGRGFRTLIVVRQVQPGSRIRLDFAWRGSAALLNSETLAAEVFAVAAKGCPWVAEVERLIRRGAL